MENLEQLRAAGALRFWQANPRANQGEDGGDVVNGLPALIVNHGLLATAAYAQAKGGSYQTIFADLLHHVAIVCSAALAPQPNVTRQNPPRLIAYLTALTQGSSPQLQQATREALAYLSYLKRFAP